MNDGTQDQVKVSFPASPTFSHIGRVAAAGLALRLGVEVADVERLRVAVDRAVRALHGPGRISLNAQWQPDRLTISIDNADHSLEATERHQVAADLLETVDAVDVGSNRIDITLIS